ncbi:hypothetical protein [Planococcus citreus]|uniref:hypothetical protein n=1 Tax=Planococcus citreus TaxID=1373 RepID=UPI001081F592|nr:hypothetical protein [Planococcus citreus]
MKKLLAKSYDEAIEFLLKKYGPSQYDYFSEKSYQRFMNGEIKNITRGKFTRSGEGLYCHHIDEIKVLKISDQLFIKENNIPFEYQRKERLVYCDLIEHTILHVLIIKEAPPELGAIGYDAYLKPMIEEWYVDKFIPKPEWMKVCRQRSFLNDDEAILIVKAMEEALGRTYHDTPFDFHETRRRRKEKIKEEIEERRRKWEEEWTKGREERRAREEEIQKKQMEEFYRTYPKFKSKGIHPQTSRVKLINLLYEYKYNDSFKNKKELEAALKPMIKDKLLRELHIVLESS